MKLPPVKRGDTWSFVFVWKNNDTPINLANCSARMQIRKRRTGTMLAESSTSNGNLSIIPTEGKVLVTFPASMTGAVEPGIHDTDLELTFESSGEVRSSKTLQLTVDEDISR